MAEAIKRAQTNDQRLASAAAAQKSASIDAYIARSALLPSVTYHNQALYTQPNGEYNKAGQTGSQAAPIFIANNAVREYASQGVVSQTIGLKQFSDMRLAEANAARATAELEVARRGLVSAVVALYYSVTATQGKVALQQQALSEASDFTRTTQEREAGREVAHADVLRAQLQLQQRQRDLNDATVAAEKARLELGVLLFPDPRTAYLTDSPETASALPTRDEVNNLASKSNPEIRSVLEGLAAAKMGVRSAKAAYLPDVALNFTYGVDAPQFAVNGPDGVRNLGYSVSATVDVPVWNWFATQKKVEQSESQRDVARAELSAAQRRLIATLEESYAEAVAAQDQLALLNNSVNTAAENLKLTKLRYAAGESTALEVIDAENSDLATKTARVDGIVRFETASAALQILMGKL